MTDAIFYKGAILVVISPGAGNFAYGNISRGRYGWANSCSHSCYCSRPFFATFLSFVFLRFDEIHTGEAISFVGRGSRPLPGFRWRRVVDPKHIWPIPNNVNIKTRLVSAAIMLSGADTATQIETR